MGSGQPSVLEAFADGATMTVDFTDIELGSNQIRAYHDQYPIAGIIGVDQETTLLAAMASEILGLRHNAPSAVEATANKHRFRSRLANSGLRAPWFTLISLDSDTDDDHDDGDEAASMPYPVVLKPLALSASRGVIRADNPSQFTVARKRIKAILAATDSQGDTATHVLVEDYIPGHEVALEGLLEGGQLRVLALFDKPDPLEGPYFEETIYLTPSRLPETVQANIVKTVSRAVATLGLREGPIHAELRINDGGAWLLEVAARSIGGLCSRALEFSAGGRLEDLIIRHAMGLPATNDGLRPPATGVMMIPTPGPGLLRRVIGLDDARAVDGIHDAVISIPLGDVLVPVPEGNAYLGFIFAKGDTPEMVEAALRLAHEKLEFEIEAL